MSPVQLATYAFQKAFVGEVLRSGGDPDAAVLEMIISSLPQEQLATLVKKMALEAIKSGGISAEEITAAQEAVQR